MSSSAQIISPSWPQIGKSEKAPPTIKSPFLDETLGFIFWERAMYIQKPDASFQKLHFYVLYSIKEFFYTVADTVVEKSVIVLPFVVSFNTVKNCD